MLDKKLINLVQQYIQERNGLLFNIQQMRDFFQENYQEYSKIPKADMRKELEKTLKHVQRKTNMSTSPKCDSVTNTSEFQNLLQRDAQTQKKRKPDFDECEVVCKLTCFEDKQTISPQSNANIPYQQPSNCDYFSKMLRDEYLKRSVQTGLQPPMPDQRLVRTSCSTADDVHSLFVIDRTGDSELMYDTSRGTLEPSIPLTDAELPVTEDTPPMCSVKKSSASESGRVQDVTSINLAQEAVAREPSVIRKQKKNNKREKTDSSDVEQHKFFKIMESEVRFSNLAASNTMLSEENIERIVTAKHPKGIIITGANGTGKSTLAEAIAGELKLPFIAITGVQLANSRNNSREEFDSLIEMAKSNAPCAIIVENILHRYSNESGRMDDMILSRLQTLFQEVNKEKQLIWVIATASKLSSIEEDLLSKGAFEVKVNLSLPKENARFEILEMLLRKKVATLASDADLWQLARNTPAYAPGDLLELIETSIRKAQLRIHKQKNTEQKVQEDSWWAKYQNLPEENEVCVTNADFEAALKVVVPAARTKGRFIESTKTTWDDVGGLGHIRQQLEISFLRPIKYPMLCSQLGLTSRPVGVLLYGPPGCGKTLVAKAMANEASVSFMAINGPELFTKYLGESERNVREIFEQAEKSAPCIIYFDEIDSLCQRREGSEGGAKANVVNQILTELDGVESREQVYVVGSTNRIDCIDEALLRPGRFSKITEIGLPDAHQRYEVLKALTKRAPHLADDVNLEEIAFDQRCEHFSGADLSGLVNAAAELRLVELSEEMDSLEERIKHGEKCQVLVSKIHFLTALENLFNERKRHLNRLNLCRKQKVMLD